MRAVIKINLLIALFILLFFTGCEKEVSVNPDDAPPDAGMIIISSNPLRAAIYLNGVITGKYTPDTIKCLPAESYKITFKIDNYNDTSVTVHLKENSKEEIFVDINGNPAMRGGLWCRTIPAEADIYINDSLISNKTPYQVKNLLPGKYEVKFRKYNHWDDSILVTVKSDDYVQINRKLIDSSLWVTYKYTNSGLPSNYVNYIYEDHKNTIWIGTFDSGLVKLRNNKWTVYNTVNSGLPNNNVYRIAVDHSDNVWIGTYDAGLVKFDGNNFTIYNIYNSIIGDNQIRAVEVDNTGRIWIGTGAAGVIVIDGEHWTKFDISNSGLPGNMIRSIAFDGIGNTWIGTYATGVARFDGTNWKSYTVANSRFPSDNVDCLYAEGDKIWFGSAPYQLPQNGPNSKLGGISYYNGSVWISYKNKPDAYVTDVCSNVSNDIWVGTNKFGLWRYTKPFSFKIQYTPTSSQLSSLSISDIMIDHNNHKWIATNGGGLVKFKGE